VEQEELRDAGRRHRPSHDRTGSARERDDDGQCGDEEDVEQNRCRRRGGETVERIQDAAQQRRQGYEEKVGKCDAAELDRERELLRIVCEAGRKDENDPWHGGHGGGRQGEQTGQQDRQRLFGEGLGRGLAALFQTAGEEGHKGRVEGAFGEDPAEHVGQAEGHHESVCDHARADEIGDQDLSDQAQDAAERRVAADGGEGAEQGHLLLVILG
jgi:hypothetical protein